MSPTYAATATREGRWWLVRVPEIDGVTQARSLAEAEVMARDLVAITLDVPQATVTVALTVDLPDDVADHLARATEAKAAAEASAATAAREAREVAARLVKAGVSLRDVGAVLGVSHQRAHQLAHSA